ncbi:MAG: SIS domain-containing protein [Candidatus Nitrosocaldaceae archaeon]
MDNTNNIFIISKNQIDRVYRRWPEIANNALEREINIKELEPSMLVVAGMGGSGTTADIISDLMHNSDIPIYTIKGYSIPQFVDNNALIIAISVSGNTEETLNIAKEAYKKNINLIGVSAGGLLERFCTKNNLMHIKITQHLAPRYSLPDVLFTTLNLISNIDSLQWLRDDAKSAINIMKNISKIIGVNNDKNIAKTIALYIGNNIPVTYTSPLLKSVGIRFKNSLNENAKILSITADIIEASHNEIAAWSNKHEYKAIIVKSSIDTPAINNRFEIFNEILNEYGHDVLSLPQFSNNIFCDIISFIYILDYASIHLAALKGVDPLSIEPINKLKERMREYNYVQC